MKLPSIFSVAACFSYAAALTLGGKNMHIERESDGLQNIVTWDEHSLFVHGQRIMLFSGEFHPYRLPVPGLWLDVFQKVKALGFNAVSFYVHWALLEGEEGVYRADGVFSVEPFFAAAKEAGLFLIARPGPYINAESSGGGFPGWLQRLPGQLRTPAPDYLAATDLYMANIGAAIAKAQVTNGGPVITVQPENEYSAGYCIPPCTITGGFPSPAYFAYVKKQLRDAGITVPFMNNDAWNQGLFAPGEVVDGTTEGDVNIYGHDSYPLGFDCANPYVWPAGDLPTYFHASHEEQSPSTPYAIPEFQGGSFDPWGGNSFEKCADLLNYEFERVFYKNNYASGIAIMSVYMIFGGTNWGNLGYSGGYTSYDYGAAIMEDRAITREKYSELKLEGNFLKVTPAFLTASVGNSVTGVYTTSATIITTPLIGNGSATNFYIIRHSDYQLLTAATYKLTVSTSKGNLTIPQLGGSLTLSGRDSKWQVTDYDLGGTNLLYSTAEIFTWKKYSSKTVLIIYGGPNELHELAVVSTSSAKTIEGSGIITKSASGTTTINWQTSSTRRVVQIGSLFVYILDRNTAYNYWVPDFHREDEWGALSSDIGHTTSVIVEAGYLIRSVSSDGSNLYVNGDVNATVPIKVIGAPAGTRSLFFNNARLRYTTDVTTGDLSSTLTYVPPEIKIPTLSSLDWKYLDDLPELQPTYDDSVWPSASHTNTTNPTTPLLTPTSLYGSDYGFHAGILLYRGHFVANGNESKIYLSTQGGAAYSSSVFLGTTYIGSFHGFAAALTHNDTYTLPNLVEGKKYIFTILVENNGYEENWAPGEDQMKWPRGILDYSLSGHAKSDVTWKITGNLGGEKYIDKVRGPLNEGGLYAERNGYHQPNPPNSHWASRSPLTGTKSAGVAFYQADFELDLPKNYDIPLSFNFGNTTINGVTSAYNVQLYVNGYQFGKYANGIGPQTAFPVPQGILNYCGKNWLAIEIWAQQASGAYLSEFSLTAGTIASTSMDAPSLVDMPSWSYRPGAY